jgi:hypothetical protein
MGRFLSPDPYRASGGPGDPGSWNRYAYVGGDPINFLDPEGLMQSAPGRNGPGEEIGPGGGTSGRRYAPGCEGNVSVPSKHLSRIMDVMCATEQVGGAGGGGDPSHPTCSSASDTGTFVDQYLTSKGSPLAGHGADFVAAANGAGINPLLLVAMAVAESNYGRSPQSQANNNPLSVMRLDKEANKYVLVTYDSLTAGIRAGARVIASQFNKGNDTIAKLYSGLPGAYCQDSPNLPCTASTVEALFRDDLHGGNPNDLGNLAWNCKQ